MKLTELKAMLSELQSTEALGIHAAGGLLEIFPSPPDLKDRETLLRYGFLETNDGTFVL